MVYWNWLCLRGYVVIEGMVNGPYIKLAVFLLTLSYRTNLLVITLSKTVFMTTEEPAKT